MANGSNNLAWDMNIPIGVPLQAQITSDETRFKARYLGMAPGQFLIMQMPGTPSLREKLLTRCNLILRFHISGVVYGFHSSVLCHTMRPVPMLFISYPNSIETFNLRKSARVDTFIEATAMIGQDIVRGVILDISAEGCCFVVDRHAGAAVQDFAPEGRLSLEFNLGNSLELFSVASKIVTSSTDSDKTKVGLSFQLTEKDGAITSRIKDFINSVLHVRTT